MRVIQIISESSAVSYVDKTSISTSSTCKGHLIFVTIILTIKVERGHAAQI